MIIQFVYDQTWLQAEIDECQSQGDPGRFIRIEHLESKKSIIILLEKDPFREGSDRGECLRAFAIAIYLTHPQFIEK